MRLLGVLPGSNEAVGGINDEDDPPTSLSNAERRYYHFTKIDEISHLFFFMLGVLQRYFPMTVRLLIAYITSAHLIAIIGHEK